MRIVAIAAAVGFVLLAGCDNQTDPSPPPTTEEALTTATTAPTTPPDEVELTTDAAPTTVEPTTTEPVAGDGPPEMPAEAREQTQGGAEAFVRQWVVYLDHVYAGGEPATVLELSGPDCQSCSALVDGVPDNPEGERTFEVLTASGELIGDELARVETDLEVLRGSGQGEGVLVFDLSFESGEWIVESIRVQEQP
ncbi:DUF6318 family protein [Ornithinimicrobium sufpigmenti]|uniref:DUF6318 family protein n=1 Tax=Ornithinimicrobium sufpigmenti TaxID=2508882 RepID=UPI0010359A4F|nr:MULTISPECIES: DUF6318 family protein [unclassified Ornithinimicrobium]